MSTTNNVDSGAPPSLWMSEEEFVKWKGKDRRAEWVAGKVILIGDPDAESGRVIRKSGRRTHNQLQRWFFAALELWAARHDPGAFIEGPQFAMRSAPAGQSHFPDVLYVAANRRHLANEHELAGAADLVVEVVAKDSVAIDYRVKYFEFEAAGVREYWIVDPCAAAIEISTLTPAGKYEPIEPKPDGTIHSVLLSGLWIQPAELFAETLPDVVERVKRMTE